MEILFKLFFTCILLSSMILLHFNSFREHGKFPYMETNNSFFKYFFKILYFIFLVSLITVIILNS
jgi:hypothetical protein